MLRRNSKKGFTLMEMLIVVAIIAILIAIAIPTMTKALEKSREATDVANIRSAYAEVMMADFNNEEPATATSEPMTQSKAGWDYVEIPDYLTEYQAETDKSGNATTSGNSEIFDTLTRGMTVTFTIEEGVLRITANAKASK